MLAKTISLRLLASTAALALLISATPVSIDTFSFDKSALGKLLEDKVIERDEGKGEGEGKGTAKGGDDGSGSSDDQTASVETDDTLSTQ